jgi:hypothetical protein
MSDPVEEVREICERLTLEHQRILLKYAKELYIAENAGEDVVNPDLNGSVPTGEVKSSGKMAGQKSERKG